MTLRPSLAARRRMRARAGESGRAEWKAAHSGRCEGCGRRGPLLRHHVVRAQDVRRYGGDAWDLANAMSLGHYCRCHADHHAPNGRRRLPLDRVPDAAVAFAVDLMGEDRAAAYFRRHYQSA